MKHSSGEGSSTRVTFSHHSFYIKKPKFTLRGANCRAVSAERGKDTELVFANRSALNAEAVQGHCTEAHAYKKISGL